MRALSPRAAATTAGVLMLLIAAVVVAGVPLFVSPPAQKITDADLVYVIGPPRAPRTALARALQDNGTAPTILISTSLVGGFTAERMSMCKREGVVCEHPEPYTTKGEAALLSRFAPEHGVTHTIVVTFTPHVTRARYIFAKCYDGDVTVVGVDQHLDLAEWIYQYAYQSAALVKAWLTPCSDPSDL